MHIKDIVSIFKRTDFFIRKGIILKEKKKRFTITETTPVKEAKPKNKTFVPQKFPIPFLNSLGTPL